MIFERTKAVQNDHRHTKKVLSLQTAINLLCRPQNRLSLPTLYQKLIRLCIAAINSVWQLQTNNLLEKKSHRFNQKLEIS